MLRNVQMAGRSKCPLTRWSLSVIMFTMATYWLYNGQQRKNRANPIDDGAGSLNLPSCQILYTPDTPFGGIRSSRRNFHQQNFRAVQSICRRLSRTDSSLDVEHQSTTVYNCPKVSDTETDPARRTKMFAPSRVVFRTLDFRNSRIDELNTSLFANIELILLRSEITKRSVLRDGFIYN